MKMLFAGARPLALVVLTAMMLAACATSGSVPQRPPLPPVDLVIERPAAVPAPRAGEDARIVAARERAARVAGDRRLLAARRTYQTIVDSMGEAR